MLKYLTSCLLVAVAVISFVPKTYAAVPDQCTPKRFRVTAYYSPLPDQAFYNMNSYTAEKIMNGQGTHGASGRGVFNGMIAAPKSYAFGTQIVFPGWGIGQVEDRGGRIVEQGERGEKYDRIDFWVGKGHDGLRRALSFGVQYIDAWICPEGSYSQSKIGFDYDVFPYYPDFFERMMRIISMSPGRDDLMVKSLQYFLVQLGYLPASDTTGYYGPRTTAAICKFQQDYLGLAASHEACGHYGPQTRITLTDLTKRRGVTLAGIRDVLVGADEVVSTKSHADVLTLSSMTQTPELHGVPLDGLFGPGGEFASYEFSRPLVPDESTKEVRILQRKLQWLDYYDRTQSISGVYDTQTIQALYALQRDKGLLNGTEHPNVRGYFGPGTRAVVNQL